MSRYSRENMQKCRRNEQIFEGKYAKMSQKHFIKKIFSTGYLPFRPGLVYGDRGTENWIKNASKTLAKR